MAAALVSIMSSSSSNTRGFELRLSPSFVASQTPSVLCFLEFFGGGGTGIGDVDSEAVSARKVRRPLSSDPVTLCCGIHAGWENVLGARIKTCVCVVAEKNE